MKYIDTHCHLNGEFYKENINASITNAQKMGIDKIILPGTNMDDSIKALHLAKEYPILFAATGIHPTNVNCQSLAFFQEIDFSKIIAIGETGIDLYWNDNPPLKKQRDYFIFQIELAKKYNKPVIVHMRNSEENVYKIIKKYHCDVKFLLHCYTSTWEWAVKFLKLDCYISFSGIVTFKSAKKLQEIARKMPIDKMLVETDAPFLAPVPFRGKHNQPAYVKNVADFIAKLRNEDDDYVLNMLYKNAIDFFKI